MKIIRKTRHNMFCNATFYQEIYFPRGVILIVRCLCIYLVIYPFYVCLHNATVYRYTNEDYIIIVVKVI